MPAWAAAISGGLEVVGGVQARNSGISLRTLRNRGRQGIAKARSTDALFGSLEESQLKKGHQDELQGFKGARAAQELGALQARRGATERGASAQGSLSQSLVSRGLIGTSTGVQAAAGLQDQTARQLQSIDLSLANSLADLGLEESALRGRQGRDLTALRRTNRDFQREMAGLEFGLLTGGSVTK